MGLPQLRASPPQLPSDGLGLPPIWVGFGWKWLSRRRGRLAITAELPNGTEATGGPFPSAPSSPEQPMEQFMLPGLLADSGLLKKLWTGFPAEVEGVRNHPATEGPDQRSLVGGSWGRLCVPESDLKGPHRPGAAPSAGLGREREKPSLTMSTHMCSPGLGRPERGPSGFLRVAAPNRPVGRGTQRPLTPAHTSWATNPALSFSAKGSSAGLSLGSVPP